MKRRGPAPAHVSDWGSGVLQPRMRELLVHLAWGRTVEDAAARMGITTVTAKHVATAAYTRLGVDNKVSAFRVLGWLHPPAFDSADPERLDGWTRRELGR